MIRSIKMLSLPAVLALAVCFVTETHAQSIIQSLGNGDIDPTNKNNKLGGFVLKGPGQRENSSSSFQVQTPRLDEDGYYYEESPNKGRYYDRSKRGTLQRDARTGRAFWKLGDLWEWAAPRYQQQLDQQEKARREQEQRNQQLIQARNMQLQQAEAYRRQVEFQRMQEWQRNEALRRQLQDLSNAVDRRFGNRPN